MPSPDFQFEWNTFNRLPGDSVRHHPKMETVSTCDSTTIRNHQLAELELISLAMSQTSSRCERQPDLRDRVVESASTVTTLGTRRIEPRIECLFILQRLANRSVLALQVPMLRCRLKYRWLQISCLDSQPSKRVSARMPPADTIRKGEEVCLRSSPFNA